VVAGAVAYVLAHRVEHEHGQLPVYVSLDQGPLEPTQGWCYGDPGVAHAILVAARHLGRPDWESAAVAIALGTARCTPAQGKVANPHFCHGASGIAHILNRMWQATGDERLAQGARRWFADALAMHAAAPASSAVTDAPWPDDPWDAGHAGEALDLRLTYGETGLGLALVAASTTQYPTWDRLFLVDPIAPSSPIDALPARH
jgi:lantibiotic biosynthesis protein